MDVAHKIMERLHTLTYKVCEYSSPRQEPSAVSSRSVGLGGSSGKSFRSEKITGSGVAGGGGGAVVAGGGVGAGNAGVHSHHSGGKERNMLRLEQSVHVRSLASKFDIVIYCRS